MVAARIYKICTVTSYTIFSVYPYTIGYIRREFPFPLAIYPNDSTKRYISHSRTGALGFYTLE